MDKFDKKNIFKNKKTIRLVSPDGKRSKMKNKKVVGCEFIIQPTASFYIRIT
jgi:hypothetical protein